MGGQQVKEKIDIRHHPSPESLAAFARGSCDKTETILIEVHLHYCQQCSMEVRKQQQHLEGEFNEPLDSLPPMPIGGPDALLQKILSQVDSQEKKTDCDDLGIPKAILNEFPDRKSWRWFSFWPSKGKVALLASDINGPYDLFIGTLDSDYKTPSHVHNHPEQTVPLVGEYVSNSQVYSKGEWSEMRPGDEHEPAGVLGGKCVCLIRSHRFGFRFTRLSWWRNALLASVHAVIKLQSRLARKKLSISG